MVNSLFFLDWFSVRLHGLSKGIDLFFQQVSDFG